MASSSKRGTRSEEVVEVGQDFGFLAAYQEKDTSLDALDAYKVVPRIKIVQGTSDAALLEKFESGTVIVSPGDAVVAKLGEAFEFVPLFFFTEFCEWSDLDDEKSDSILDRSFDPTSDVAVRARNFETREKAYGSGFTSRCVEHLNFCGVIYGDHPLAGTSVVLGFSRGEFGTGKSWIGGIRMRRANGMKVPLYAQVWSFECNFRDKGPKKKWHGVDPKIPQISMVQASEIEGFKALHDEFEVNFQKDRLRVDHSASKDEVGKEPTTNQM